MSAKLSYRPDIDGLRALAIVSVVVFHAFPDCLQGGFVGVDIFFVISGFLISQIIFVELAGSRFSFSVFYARRVRRIFPSLFVTLIATLLLGWYLLSPELYESLGKHTLAGSGFLANVLDWKESGYFDAKSRPLLHLWSLGIEEQFYIVWPVLLWAAWRARARLLVVISTVLIVSFCANVYLSYADLQGDFYLPQARFWELLIGCLLAYASLSPTPEIFAGRSAVWIARWSPELRDQVLNASSICGFGLICLSFIVINPQAAFPGWWALLPTVGAALMIAAGSKGWLNRTLLSSRPMVWIGLISFQLYLWHWPMLFFLRAASEGIPSSNQRVLAVVFSVVLAWLTWTFVDKPIRFGPNRRLSTIMSCAALILSGVFGYAVFALHGIPSRYPQSIQELANFHFHYGKPYRSGSCFLEGNQTAADFTGCSDGPITASANTKTVLLWGDSYAAHLYPGLSNSLRGSIRLTQFTASGCPPIVDTDYNSRKHCREINDFVVEKVSHQPPDEVILAADWPLYDWKLLSNTLNRLSSAGIRSITVVGPVPQWKGSLVETIYKFLKSAPDMTYVPQWMKFGVLPQPLQTDQEMAAYFAGKGVKYVSAIHVLCNENGCLTRTGTHFDSLTAWDDGHLTTEGSIYLVAHSGLAVID